MDTVGSGQPVVVAGGAYAFALHPEDGSELWRVKVPGSFGTQFTTALIEGDALFLSRGNRVSRVDLWSGTVQWTVKLSKSSVGVTMLAGSASSAAGMAAVQAAQRAAAAAAAG